MSKSDKYTKHNKDKYIVGAIFVALMAVGFYVIWATSQSKPISNPLATTTVPTNVEVSTSTATTTVNLTPLDNFASCLASKGVAMYGAAWCTHCQNQKKLFGESWKYVKYVECPDNTQLCLAKGIEGYPTWINAAGQKLSGEQSFEALAQFSGCPLPK